MSSAVTGRQAETAAVEHLIDSGYHIRHRNWRTRYCEIDIVAELKNVIYLIEVKYRHGEAQGSGLDYITPRKLQQMRFAAEMWITHHDWEGQYQLGAIEICGPNFEVGIFLPDCT